MNRMKKLLLILLALSAGGFITGFATGFATGCASEPKTYADCLLRYMKPGMGDFASRAVCVACREKFPSIPDATDEDLKPLP